MKNHDFEVLHWSYSYQSSRTLPCLCLNDIRKHKDSETQQNTDFNIKHPLSGFNSYIQKTLTDYLSQRKTNTYFSGMLHF